MTDAAGGGGRRLRADGGTGGRGQAGVGETFLRDLPACCLLGFPAALTTSCVAAPCRRSPRRKAFRAVCSGLLLPARAGGRRICLPPRSKTDFTGAGLRHGRRAPAQKLAVDTTPTLRWRREPPATPPSDEFSWRLRNRRSGSADLTQAWRPARDLLGGAPARRLPPHAVTRLGGACHTAVPDPAGPSRQGPVPSPSSLLHFALRPVADAVDFGWCTAALAPLPPPMLLADPTGGQQHSAPYPRYCTFGWLAAVPAALAAVPGSGWSRLPASTVPPPVPCADATVVFLTADA